MADFGTSVNSSELSLVSGDSEAFASSDAAEVPDRASFFAPRFRTKDAMLHN